MICLVGLKLNKTYTEVINVRVYFYLQISTIMTMEFVHILIIWIAIGLVEPGNIGPKRSPSVPKLNALFDIEAQNENSLGDKKDGVCDMEACQIIATEFMRGMNRSADPCENFYEFVCGTWGDLDQIPAYESKWSRFHIYQEVVDRRIKGILETEPVSTDILPVRQAKKWYRACMDINALEKRGIKPLESILLQVGGWPMTLDPEEWNEDEHTWQSVEHDYLHITGAYVFYSIGQTWDGSRIKVTEGNIPLDGKLPPEFRNYTGDDYENYAALIAGVTQMFVEYNKASVTDEMMEKDVQDLIELERKLYTISESINRYDDDVSIAEFEKMYIDNITELELDNTAVKIEFGDLIRKQFDMVNRQINESSMITYVPMSYFLKLTEILNETPTRTIVNYLHWHFVSDMLWYTTELMRDAFFALQKNEDGVKERSPRWLECINEVEMRTAGAYAFVQKYYSQEAEDTGREMIKNVQHEMKSQIDASPWMDDEFKAQAKEKVDSMKAILGFPDWYKNKTAVLNSYKGLTIGYEHFDNVLSFRKYRIKKLLQPIDPDLGPDSVIFDSAPSMVNAFYNPVSNTIELPAALFQPPLFTSRVPPSVNYGIIGLAVAHEMGHGFDVEGIEYGADGNETNMSENMQELYSERADCFVHQFNEYYDVTEGPEVEDSWRYRSRGRKTQPDNMADSIGLQSIFKAYKKLISDGTVENLKLPGFEEYTPDQMFFISFAATWCEAATPKYAKYLEKYDNHSPGRLRVKGPLANLNDFSKAYNCPMGTEMNPEVKCNIWE